METRLSASERRIRAENNEAMEDKNEVVDYSFMNYTEALNKVVRKWYE